MMVETMVLIAAANVLIQLGILLELTAIRKKIFTIKGRRRTTRRRRR